jgi:ribosomal protein S18 acetylase RimI-like enzyme
MTDRRPGRGKVRLVVTYRRFRNDDPPRLVEVWNEAFTGRGAVKLRHSSPLDNYILAKPYFDPAGLIVAEDNRVCVGFAHAGFGPNADEMALSREAGVVCLLGVRPAFRGRGIGSELLRRCETYLTDAGATSLHAGPLRPLNPFYLGLYGGSELPGFLASDVTMEPFFLGHGYRVHQTSLVYQRQLIKPVNVTDGRFAGLRQQYEVVVAPVTGIASWWQECVLGPLELIEFRLEEKPTGRVAARCRVWEMEGFSWRWNLPAVGITEVEVREDVRRRGLAKFLLAQILRYLQDQFFGVAEVHALEDNEPALRLFQGLGFEQVDVGRMYRKEGGEA